jgi:hypothetical protein
MEESPICMGMNAKQNQSIHPQSGKQNKEKGSHIIPKNLSAFQNSLFSN